MDRKPQLGRKPTANLLLAPTLVPPFASGSKVWAPEFPETGGPVTPSKQGTSHTGTKGQEVNRAGDW